VQFAAAIIEVMHGRVFSLRRQYALRRCRADPPDY